MIANEEQREHQGEPQHQVLDSSAEPDDDGNDDPDDFYEADPTLIGDQEDFEDESVSDDDMQIYMDEIEDDGEDATEYEEDEPV